MQIFFSVLKRRNFDWSHICRWKQSLSQIQFTFDPIAVNVLHHLQILPARNTKFPIVGCQKVPDDPHKNPNLHGHGTLTGYSVFGKL